MGLLEWRYGVGSLELEFGTPEARISEIDIWKSGFPEWISGRSVFQDGYLGPEYGSPEVRSPFPYVCLALSYNCLKFRYIPNQSFQLGSTMFAWQNIART
jgi:hypothetical protein